MYLGFSGDVLTLNHQLKVVDCGTVIVSHCLARKAGFSGDVLTLNQQLKVVDCGTVIVSHCLARKATGNVAVDSIVLYKFILSIPTGIM